MNPIDLDCTSESEMPSAPALMGILRGGGRLSCSGHTLSLADRDHGPTILWGTNACGSGLLGKPDGALRALVAPKDNGPGVHRSLPVRACA